MGWFRMLLWSLKLDAEFLFRIPDLPLAERLRFVLLKYLLFVRDRCLSSREPRGVRVFGMKYLYDDRFGLGSLQRVYCASWSLKGLLPQNPVVVDVGANLGQFNFFCRHYLGSPRVLSVEPIPSCFRLLELNSGDPADCVNAAVAPIAGEISLHVARDSQLSSVIPDEGGDYEAPILVESLPLDLLLDESCVERVDLLKIDTEGSEMDVLRSGERVLERCDAVLIEMSAFRKSSGNLFTVGKYLEDRGFRLWELIFDRARLPKDVDGVFTRS